MESITKPSWSRKFNAEEPHASVHTFARPPMMEALSLLPIAYRVGSYINKERNRGSEPIFDLSGLCLEPPKPGPNAGAPLGGLGGGSIGRGFRGDFRRWSLEPGRYVHRVIAVDSFSLRVKRGDQIYSQVLSMQNSDEGSPLASWKWNLPASCGTYHALYPRAWTVYENPVPDITVVIEQISPFLPESYSESSMPCAVFQVEVINTSATSEAEASVMFSFQNGYGGGNSCTACNTTASNGCCTCNSSSGAERATANTSGWDVCGGLAHCSFSVADDTQHPPTHGAAGDSKEEPHSWSGEVRGVCMTHPSAAPVDSVNTVTCPQCSASRNPCAPYIACATMDRVESPEANTTAETTTTAQSTASSPAPPNSPPPLDQDNSPLEDAYANCNCSCNCNFDRSGNSGLGSFAIAARVPIPSTASSNLAVGDHGSCGSGVRKEPVVSTCAQFVTEVVTPPANFPILSYFCGSRQQSDIEGAYLKSDPGDTGGRALWNSFETTGDIQDIPAPQNVADTQQIGQQKNVSKAGTRVGGAVCVRQWLAPATNAAPPSAAPASAAAGGDRVSPAENRKMYSFSLSWDNPYVRFGSSGTAKDCPAIDDPSNGKSNISGCDSDSAQPSSAPPPSDPSGSGSYLPRYYTRFFGTSGLAAPKITAFALSQVQDWRQRIAAWQARTLRNSDGATAGVRGSGGDAYAGGEGDGASGALEGRLSDTGNGDGGTDGAGSTGSMGSAGGGYYDHQLFNELYFLVDGGTVWTDSTAGVSNQLQPRPPLSQQLAVQSNFNTAATRPQADDKHSSNSREGNQWCAMGIQSCSSENDLLVPLTGQKGQEFNGGSSSSLLAINYARLQTHLSTLNWSQLKALHQSMLMHDLAAQNCTGDQRAVGQFLYLEGHEYLMYNTYDVHFYASFALLMLWPQLELSLQGDFATAVSAADPTTRVMMGTGDVRPRKVQGVVPHDLGSPSEAPWTLTNAYNFQDVSRWKDLGPKFVLQIYRDYVYLQQQQQRLKEKSVQQKSLAVSGGCAVDSGEGLERFLAEMYPVLCTVMASTRAFDTDGDGMIENSGFPDQTYDIWTATGVHAYCGGLWIAACEVMVKVAALQGDIRTSEEYHTLAGRARGVYVAALWNGRYLNYDSSSSAHHDSIMADMLAGQWYVRACGLPPVVSPDVALSCYRTIYQHNVVDFGEGRLLGAVNGTRPPLEFDTQPGKTVLSLPVSPLPSSDSDDGGLMSELSPSVSAPIALPPAVSKAKVDNSCMQSREVWTGTTYALAAAMIQEAVHYSAVETHPCASVTDGLITTTESDSSPLPAQQTIPDDTSGSTGGAAVVGAGVTAGALTAAERAELLEMAHRTAQGIHDAGWQEFGYWFATPEGWERSGNYRSLGYMRALGIWAMQFAKQQNQSRHA